MSEERTRFGSERPDGTEGDERAIAELVRSAGGRPEPSAEDLATITAAARAEWRRRYAAPRTRSRMPAWVPLAAAAGIAVVGITLALRRGSTTPVVATLERWVGEGAVVAEAGAAREPLDDAAQGRGLVAGSSIESGENGRIAVALVGGESLRLDARSRVRLISASAVELVAGAIYVDDGPAAARSLVVRTPIGELRPVGTQYEVRLAAGADEPPVRLRVREGSVALERDGEASVIVAAGEEVAAPARGEVVRRPLEGGSASWTWAVEIAPAIPIEGRIARAYLAAVVREQGWRLAPMAPEVEAIAASCVLRGSVDALGPAEALEVALASCDLALSRDGDLLRIVATSD